MVSLLTSPGHRVLDPARMPSSDTSNFLKPLWVFLGSFLVCHLLVTPLNPWPLVTPMMSIISSAANTAVTGTSFSKWFLAKSTLSATKDLHLRVDNHTDGGAVFLHLSQLLLNLLLAEIVGPLGAGLGEGLLLGLRPVLVKPSLGLFANMFGPNSLEGSHTPGGLDVSNNTDADDGRRLDDGDGLHDLLLVDL